MASKNCLKEERQEEMKNDVAINVIKVAHAQRSLAVSLGGKLSFKYNGMPTYYNWHP
jgi:hypothetical protein